MRIVISGRPGRVMAGPGYGWRGVMAGPRGAVRGQVTVPIKLHKG